MKVPRPTGGSRQSNGVGKIFVKFDTPESAGKALRALAGRKFADRTVVTTYFSEVGLTSTTYYEFLLICMYRKILKCLLGKLTLGLYRKYPFASNPEVVVHFCNSLPLDLNIP